MPSLTDRAVAGTSLTPGALAEVAAPAVVPRVGARDPYIDSLRALAILRVYVYHALGVSWLPVLFPSIPIMLGLAGFLMARSLDRGNAAGVLRGRLRRLLPPLWVLGAVAVPLMMYMGWAAEEESSFHPIGALCWAMPVCDPPGSDWGDSFWSALWYLRAYLWLVLLSPLLLWNFRRWPRGVLLASLGVLLLMESPDIMIDTGPVGTAIWGLVWFTPCWLIGFAAHDGLLERVPAPAYLAAALGFALWGLSFALLNPDPEDPSLFAEPLAETLWAIGFVLVLMRFRPDMAWMQRIPGLAWFVSAFNARAVTIYIWHLPCQMLAEVLLDSWGGPEVLALGIPLTACAVLALGWVEDVAAGRRPSLIPA
jgi:peptidoglycan/LPS O-acetylase OafA/YrhL